MVLRYDSVDKSYSAHKRNHVYTQKCTFSQNDQMSYMSVHSTDLSDFTVERCVIQGWDENGNYIGETVSYPSGEHGKDVDDFDKYLHDHQPELVFGCFAMLLCILMFVVFWGLKYCLRRRNRVKTNYEKVIQMSEVDDTDTDLEREKDDLLKENQ